MRFDILTLQLLSALIRRLQAYLALAATAPAAAIAGR